ncbi:MAG: hypothetical protein L0241_20185 [Planctomycetia bacterium]|nr:hypothetical protein [Planctomycetia bacterium]
MLLRVVNIVSGDERYFDAIFGPVAALAAVYARTEMKDWDVRDYERKYVPLVQFCGEVFRLGDWVCWAKSF